MSRRNVATARTYAERTNHVGRCLDCGREYDISGAAAGPFGWR